MPDDHLQEMFMQTSNSWVHKGLGTCGKAISQMRKGSGAWALLHFRPDF